MLGTISSNVAAAAVALHRSHARAPVLECLDVALRQRTGSIADFGPDVCAPSSPFGQLLAEAFDTAMVPDDWALATHRNTPPQAAAALMQLWHDVVLVPFAARYGLTM